MEHERLDLARELMKKAGKKLVLPSGSVIARELKSDAETRTVQRDALPKGWAVYDIDPATEKSFASIIERAGTVVWNGPMGVFETQPLITTLPSRGNAPLPITRCPVIGGGDSRQRGTGGAATRYPVPGSGASLEFGGEEPGWPLGRPSACSTDFVEPVLRKTCTDIHG